MLFDIQVQSLNKVGTVWTENNGDPGIWIKNCGFFKKIIIMCF
jgi:hypothetical protein